MKPIILIAIPIVLVLALVGVGVGRVAPAASTAQPATAVAGPNRVQPVRSAAELDALLARTEGDLVLDFSATWCPPCRLLAPQLETFARANPATVAVIDVDEVAELAQRYAIVSMPTLIHLRDGKEVKRSVGYRDAPAIAAWVASGS